MTTVAPLTKPLVILYLEDDPVLRELLGDLLRAHPRVAEVRSCGDPREAIDQGSADDVDVALLDLALGDGRTSGVEVGMALRGARPRLPIVIFTQHAVAAAEDILPPSHRHAWSFLRKTGHFDVDALLAAIDATIGGEMLADVPILPSADVSPLQALTRRQREVMALVSTGLDARAISERLFLAHVTVRSELSRAYRVLAPDAPPGTDLRTTAVLEYLRLTAPPAEQ